MMSSREVIQRLEADGWRIVRQVGSHVQLKHDSKPGTVTVPHPKKDFHVKMIRSIEQQSGAKLR